MSIYSGFATRAQQECYDQAIEALLYVLQRRIIKFYKCEEADEEKFISLVLKIHGQLRSMENNKYLEPKTSHSLNQLIKFMLIHEKSGALQKSKTSDHNLGDTSHQGLPVMDPRTTLQQTHPKKKQSLWVEKNLPKKQNLVDQEMQTMGIIYERKDSSSPKQKQAKSTFNRPIAGGHKTKYVEKHYGKSRQELAPLTFGNSFKNRSQSHNLASNDSYNSHNNEVKNHLREVQAVQRKKRRTKMNHKLGLKQLNTVQDNSEYEVGDIIKQYVSRIKKKYQAGEHFRPRKDTLDRMNDF